MAEQLVDEWKIGIGYMQMGEWGGVQGLNMHVKQII